MELCTDVVLSFLVLMVAVSRSAQIWPPELLSSAFLSTKQPLLLDAIQGFHPRFSLGSNGYGI